MQPLPNRLPLVLGVAGPRDLREEDVVRLEFEVATFMAALRRDYLGNDEATPIIVLSSLAEGAARLLARVALDHGAQLIVPMPMPAEEYRRDFEPGLQPGNVAEFDALLARAIAAPVMPYAGGNSQELVQTDMQRRNEQYRAASRFILRHSDLLLAIGDGDATQTSVGDTAEVVRFKGEGVPPELSRSARASLDGSEIGPVALIEAPQRTPGGRIDKVRVLPWGRAVVRAYRGDADRRRRDCTTAFFTRLIGREPPDVRAKLSPEQRRELDVWEAFGLQSDLTQQFNSEAVQLEAMADGPARIGRNLDMLFEGSPAPIPGATDAKTMALTMAPRWPHLYAIADTLAQVRQAQLRHDWMWLFGCAFVAFACFAVLSHSGREFKPMLVCYGALFILILYVFSRARRMHHLERFIDYRALAEALRVAIFWRFVGIVVNPTHGKVDAAGDGAYVNASTPGVLAAAFPILQPGGLAWMKICLSRLALLDRAEGVAGEHALDAAGHAVARESWVLGYGNALRRRSFHHHAIAENIGAWAIVLTAVGAFVLVPILLFQGVDVGRLHWFGWDAHYILLVLAGLLPALAAAMIAYSECLAYRAQARQDGRAAALFQRAYALLPEQIDATTSPWVRSLYRELGVESLRQNAEWAAIYRPRPIEPLQSPPLTGPGSPA